MERFVRFQEPRYRETVLPALSRLVAHVNFLRRSGTSDFVSEVLSSKELFDLTDIRQKSFWWKAGRYNVTIKLSSPGGSGSTRSQFAFDLTSF